MEVVAMAFLASCEIGPEFEGSVAAPDRLQTSYREDWPGANEATADLVCTSGMEK